MNSTKAGTMEGTMVGGVSKVQAEVDPVLASIISNRFRSVTREMNEALMRSARSALIAVCRDLSGAILTPEGELVAIANSLPAHMLGTGLQVASLRQHHPNPEPGDAFLHNDPYEGATHPADWVIMVPVFAEGKHCLTIALLAHQADIGNSLPTTYMHQARDIYEEGVLLFTATQVQRGYEDIDDIIRMCRKRIRSPEEWYGDYRAMVGAARLAERQVHKVLEQYGLDEVLRCTTWMADYAEQMVGEAIGRLPRGEAVFETRHDPAGDSMPDGYRVKAKVRVEPTEGVITVDLRENDDCLPNGLNLSENTATAAAMQGVLDCIPENLPLNGGTLRRIQVLLRDGAAVGRPTFPHSCSLATTNLLCRTTMAVHGAFAELGHDLGIAESGLGMSAGWGVIAGIDRRRKGRPAFQNQLFTGFAGGPATAFVDGWVNSGSTGGFAMNLRDSVEILEAKYPVIVKALRVAPGSGGAGRFRGAPGEEFVFGPRFDPISLGLAADGQHFPPRGVKGGCPGGASSTHIERVDGSRDKLPGLVDTEVEPGEFVWSLDNGGGGYGHPYERDPQRVALDVMNGIETMDRARDVYKVAFINDDDPGRLVVDRDRTAQLRSVSR